MLIFRGIPYSVTRRVSQAMDDAGAHGVDVQLFSGVLMVLSFELAAGRAPALLAALDGAGVRLDAAGRAAVEGLPAKDDTVGTLAVTFAEGDPDLRRVTPAVPG
jgi:hypothetical protein